MCDNKLIKIKPMYKTVIGILLGIGILSAQTIVSVQPANIADRNLMPGDTFTVNIYVQNVTNLYAYQSVLQYKPDVLTFVSATKGPFLSQGGTTTFIRPARVRRHGFILLGEVLLGEVPGVSGGGVLTKILFRVNKRGKTYLDLSYTGPQSAFLLDSDLKDIGYNTLNGEFSNE